MTRLPQALRKRTVVLSCFLLLGGLALSASHWGSLSRLSQGRSTSPRPHSVELKWKASASSVVGYNVYRTEGARPLTKLTPMPISVTEYVDPTVQSGHTYLYMVTAVDSQGRESIYSNQVKAVVPGP